MTDCILCHIMEGKIPSKKVYEDDEVLAVLDINGANLGHCFVMPKQHYSIMEQVPDHLVGRIFQIANQVSSAVFEVLDVKGTNIFVTNGVTAGQVVAHFMVSVIPRKENDGINLQWQPKQLTEEEMSTVELQLKDALGNISLAPEPKKMVKKETEEKEEYISDEDDYVARQIKNKIP